MIDNWVAGIDTHKYSGLMNYQTARQNGVDFVLAKNGGGYTDTGGPYTDNQWLNNITNAPPVIAPFGAWWYLSGFASTVVAQANWCADLIIPQKQKINLGFWLDCEHWPMGMAPSANRDLVLRFIDVFEERATIPVRGIYTRQSIWDSYVAPHARWGTLDLWPARYSSSLTSPWSDNYYRFRDWQTWRFWQYSADGNYQGQHYGSPPPPAADYDMDLDRWALTLDDLYDYADLGDAPLSYTQKVDILWEEYLEEHPDS